MKKHSKQSNKSNNKGSIRIIAGKHRGRKLPVLMAEGLRPTTDRVKETVFNWLMPYIQDSNCLDCFAGSGGLGFEAISRGAKNVTLVEMNKAAAQQISANKLLLKENHITVTQADALEYLATCKEKFDLVFVDPPFRKGLAEKTCRLLDENCLADNAIIYLEKESEDRSQLLPSQWQLLKEKVAGQVIYQLYQKV